MQQMNLIDLPNDVLQLIVQSLTVEPLFTPRCTIDDFGRNAGLIEYNAKCKKYYGAQEDSHDQCAQGLVSWSASSKRFRRFLSPYLFKTVVLRDTPRSIASMKYLSTKTCWNYIQHFIFATIYNTSKLKKDDSEGDDGNEDKADDADDTIDDLSTILSHLPPNLQSLILDLPEGSDNRWEGSFLEPYPPNSDSEIPLYRLALRSILNSISVNDVSKKPSFHLKLYNICPYHSIAFHSNSWKIFLSNVTSFTLYLKHYDNSLCWNMNMHLRAADLAPDVGKYFFDSLERVQSFNLYCDLLCGPDELMQPLEPPFPSNRIWRDLRHVSFKETFICTRTVEFLQAHLDTIETIELVDCFAPKVDDIEGNRCESWQSFFKCLADAEPPRLHSMRIHYIYRNEDDLLRSYGQSAEEQQRKEEARKILRQQEEDLKQMEDEIERARVEERQKKLLAYYDEDDTSGVVAEGEEMIVSKFLNGKDHEEWLRLVDVMQENRKFTSTC